MRSDTKPKEASGRGRTVDEGDGTPSRDVREGADGRVPSGKAVTKAYGNYLRKCDGLLAAAYRLFLTLGYEGTTMDAVAAEAGVTKQTVYRYYPSKADLLRALIESRRAEGAAFVFGDGPAFEELGRYAEAFLAFHMSPDGIGFYRLMISESGRNRELGEIFEGLMRPRWKSVLTAFLGERLRLAEADRLAGMLNAMLLYARPAIVMGTSGVPDAAEIAAIARTATELFWRGAEVRL